MKKNVFLWLDNEKLGLVKNGVVEAKCTLLCIETAFEEDFSQKSISIQISETETLHRKTKDQYFGR